MGSCLSTVNKPKRKSSGQSQRDNEPGKPGGEQEFEVR